MLIRGQIRGCLRVPQCIDSASIRIIRDRPPICCLSLALGALLSPSRSSIPVLLTYRSLPREKRGEGRNERQESYRGEKARRDGDYRRTGASDREVGGLSGCLLSATFLASIPLVAAPPTLAGSATS
ncbi:unnamed protein product [Caenorhabditis auriculariae]|uniref:Uncharacterized protein n=1 Tax=Caenorhabditis auriculariae TaxID=2777116 RepID=A0A8S1HGG9_9PELO|nr:unnamed protein product [Caenorhabditis auriculariae]